MGSRQFNFNIFVLNTPAVWEVLELLTVSQWYLKETNLYITTDN